MEENSKIGKKVADFEKKSQKSEEIHWQPVAKDFEEQEKRESEALQKPDFYNRLLLLRRKNEGLG